MTYDVEAIAYNDAPNDLRRQIAVLQELAYGPSEPPDDDSRPLHDPALNAQAFFIRDGERVISYAAAVTTTIVHDGQTYTLAGISCVATEPELQRRGLGRRVVAAATRYIEACGVDLGVFTCAPALAGFYADAGGWPVAPEVVLIANRDPDALSSSRLGVVVLLRLFSPKARTAAPSLLHGTIDLGFPAGQFL